MHSDLNKLETKAEKSNNNVADIKVDIKYTNEKISVAQETTVALKNGFKSLLDQINMTLGKLNAIDERANSIKTKVIETQSLIKQEK